MVLGLRFASKLAPTCFTTKNDRSVSVLENFYLPVAEGLTDIRGV